MNGRTRQRRLSSRDLTRILGVTSALAAPFDLMTMLGEVVAAAKQVLRLGADLEAAFTQDNNRLAETLPADRFITAFVGIVEPATHRLRFHSGGQGPVFHFQAATKSFAARKPTSLPLGAVDMFARGAPQEDDMTAVLVRRDPSR